MIYAVATILFILACLALAHTYLFYPFLLQWLAKGKSNNKVLFSKEDELPFVSIIMSLYNEEKVIRQKLETLLNQNYPADKLRIFIGSDGSADGTNAIVTEMTAGKPGVHFFPFAERRGKPGVLNHLVDIAFEHLPASPAHVLLITDASVMLSPDVTFHLVKHFRHPDIAVVDAYMLHTGLEDDGISRSEDRYISREVRLKHLESIVWRKMIGPFGGCYALRSDHFSKVPSNFLVDDFFITMKAFERGGLAVNEPQAVCYEPVSHDWREEFRRKARISAGNFQNMALFRKLWWPPFNAAAFAFFSHKILRWLGPFFIAVMVAAGAVAAVEGNFFSRFLFLCVITPAVLAPVMDAALSRAGINCLVLRNVRYFLLMNLALLQGFFRFVKGVRSNVWEPTKRH